jgi:hypothetical protein
MTSKKLALERKARCRRPLRPAALTAGAPGGGGAELNAVPPRSTYFDTLNM